MATSSASRFDERHRRLMEDCFRREAGSSALIPSDDADLVEAGFLDSMGWVSFLRAVETASGVADLGSHLNGQTASFALLLTVLRDSSFAPASPALAEMDRHPKPSSAIAVIAAFGSISQSGGGTILSIPLAFAGSWCLFWGWSPVWNGFRRTFGGWSIFGTWLFLLIVTVLISEILVGVAMLVGAFTGIKKYNEAKRTVANGNQMIAELSGMPIQQLPGTQGGSTA